MMPMAVGAFVAAIVLTALPAMSQSVWNIDPAHSAAQFQVKHLMISTVRGEFTRLSGKVSFDPKDFSTVKAEAAIETASINTREPKRDDHLRSEDFFHAAKYPQITFKSKRVEAIQGRNFKLVGDLTMRGVTREITLDVETTPIVKGMSGEPRIGAHATATLNRQDYGIKWNRALDAGGMVVSNEVRIVLDLELTRAGDGESM